MIRIENGKIMMAGSMQDIFMEVAKLIDVVAFQISENGSAEYDKTIEMLLTGADKARIDREENDTVSELAIAKSKTAATPEELNALFDEAQRVTEAGGTPDQVKKSLLKSLVAAGMETIGTQEEVLDDIIADADEKPKKEKKKDKKDKKEKKEKKKKKKKEKKEEDQNIEETEMVEPADHFKPIFVTPQKFKKAN